MIRHIWKYELAVKEGAQTIEVPKHAKTLHLHEQNGNPCIWFLVDATKDKEVRTFSVYGTGWEIELSTYVRYIGTCHIGSFVWHVFES